MHYRILAINPGSTSTKVSVYDDENPILIKSITHKAEEIDKYDEIYEQYEMRKDLILRELKNNDIDIKSINAIVARGGLLPPVKSGAYLVNKEMVNRLKYNPVIEHVSNLAAIIAYEIGKEINVNSYIYDSVSVDEFTDVARISGLKDMDRICVGHTLNCRATAIKYSKIIAKEYNQLNLIVAHLGGGITIQLHEKGKIVDIVTDDEGPFSSNRSGRLPLKKVINECYSNKYSQKEMNAMIRGKGGIYSYLNTIDTIEVEKKIEQGDLYAKLIYDAMAYQISKGIGELATVVDGNIDAIILTGGVSYSTRMTNMIKNKVGFISKIEIIAGENELEALTFGALRVLKGEEKAHVYIEK
ncbi:MAG: butyrate kinase [Peptostreptococcaceae bacterium]